MSAASGVPTGLSVEGLACRRGERMLFENVSFRRARGEALWVSGANGSGKTSLLRVLAGLSHAAAGRIGWEGRTAQPSAVAYRSTILYLGHTVPVRDDLTILENLAAQLALDDVRLERRALFEALALVGLAERHGLAARTLSLGQRRRLGLARARLACRSLWLLDEPATGLDAAGVTLLETVVADHLQGGGIAVMTAHQPPPAALAMARLDL